MNDSLKLRSLSGWTILLLGGLLFVTSFMPAVLRDGQSPTAGMLGVFGLLAIGIGIALSAMRDATLSEAAARRFCVALMSLVFAAAGGFFDVLVQRTSFFDGLGSLHTTLVVLFAALFGAAVFACLAIARKHSAAFLAPSESMLSLGGSIDPLSFLVLQPMFLIFAAVAAGLIAAEAGGTRGGLLLAIALALAALPFFITVQLALCAKRWRDTTRVSTLFSFQGRISRQTFWLMWIGLMEIHFIAGLLLQIAGRGTVALALICLLWLPLTVGLGLSMQVRRWHDRGKSGWMILVGLIPIVGLFWPLIELGFLRGTIGANRFGNDPLPK